MKSEDGDILLEIHPEASCCRKLILAAIPLTGAAVVPVISLLILGAPVIKVLLVGLVIGLPAALIFLAFRHILNHTLNQFSCVIYSQKIEIYCKSVQETFCIPRSEIVSWNTDNHLNVYLYLCDKSTCCNTLPRESPFAFLIVKPNVVCIFHWMTNGGAQKIIAALESKL
jgi:hypothetical protein